MAISFINYIATSGGAAEPASTVAGDFIFVVCESETTSTPGAPSGWTQLGTSLSIAANVANIFWIVRGGSAPSYAFTNLSSGGTISFTLRGIAKLDNVATGTAASATAPSVNATYATDWLLCFFGDAASTAITAPAGMTEPGTPQSYFALAYLALSSSGATGTKTFGGASQPTGAWSATAYVASAAITSTATATSTIIATTGANVNAVITATSTITANVTSPANVTSTITGTNTTSAYITSLGAGALITATSTVVATIIYPTTDGISSYTANKFLGVLNNTSFTGIASVYVQLHTGSPGPSGTSNVSSFGSRKVITWLAPSAGSMLLNVVPLFSMTSSEIITDVSLWDGSSGGNYLWSAQITPRLTVINGSTIWLTTFTVSILTIAS